MSINANKELVRQAMAALDGRRLDGVIAYSAPDCRYYGFAPDVLDNDGYREMMSGLLAAFPDSRFPVDDLIAEGNLVAAPHQMTGTHRGPFQGVPASGRMVTVPAIALFRIEDGLVREIRLSADFMGLLQQIGAIPAPDPGPAHT